MAMTVFNLALKTPTLWLDSASALLLVCLVCLVSQLVSAFEPCRLTVGGSRELYVRCSGYCCRAGKEETQQFCCDNCSLSITQGACSVDNTWRSIVYSGMTMVSFIAVCYLALRVARNCCQRLQTQRQRRTGMAAERIVPIQPTVVWHSDASCKLPTYNELFGQGGNATTRDTPPPAYREASGRLRLHSCGLNDEAAGDVEVEEAGETEEETRERRQQEAATAGNEQQQ